MRDIIDEIMDLIPAQHGRAVLTLERCAPVGSTSTALAPSHVCLLRLVVGEPPGVELASTTLPVTPCEALAKLLALLRGVFHGQKSTTESVELAALLAMVPWQHELVTATVERWPHDDGSCGYVAHLQIGRGTLGHLVSSHRTQTAGAAVRFVQETYASNPFRNVAVGPTSITFHNPLPFPVHVSMMAGPSGGLIDMEIAEPSEPASSSSRLGPEALAVGLALSDKVRKAWCERHGVPDPLASLASEASAEGLELVPELEDRRQDFRELRTAVDEHVADDQQAAFARLRAKLGLGGDGSSHGQ